MLLRGADVMVGLSRAGAVSPAAVRTMADRAVVFAMANPAPEVQPEDVGDAVAVMATGRSDYPNQINNVLAFPGVFRGALDVRARTINEQMKLARRGRSPESSRSTSSTPSTSSRACSTGGSSRRSPSRRRGRDRVGRGPATSLSVPELEPSPIA
jgi:hypothetical protein